MSGAILSVAGHAHAGPIVNGTFETGNFTGWTTTGDVNVGNEANIQNAGSYSAYFNAGDKAPNGTISQTFATTVGAEYDVSFLYGALNTPQSITASVKDGSNNVLVQSLETSGPNIVGGVDDLTTYNLIFIATSATSTISFADVASNNTISDDGVLDNVSASLVPEPGSLLVVASGLIGFTFVRRRRAS